MDKRNLYTINQLARACSVTRSTILRLEEEGHLTPVCREGTGEYRYYDCASVMQALQILALQKMGFTRKDIHEYLRVPGDFNNCLAVLEERLAQMEQIVQTMRLRVDLKNHMKIERIHIPETVCYITSFSTKWDYHYVNNRTQVAFKEAIDFGLKVDGTKEFFAMVDCPALLAGEPAVGIYEHSICIPLTNPKGTPHTTAVPACDALAITWYHGQPESRIQAYTALGNALQAKQLTPIGPLRVFGIIHQYMGANISAEFNVIRITQPVQP